MKAYRGYLQGYNAQTVTTERQVIVAAEIAPDGLDFTQLDPMVAAAERELAEAGVKELPEARSVASAPSVMQTQHAALRVTSARSATVRGV